MKHETKKGRYNIYSYILFYFALFFLAIMFVDYFHSSLFIFDSTMNRTIFIGVLLYLGLIGMNFYWTGYFKPFYALLELFPLIPVILYIKGKFFSNKESNPGLYFKLSIFLFISFFIFTILLSILFLLYKPLFFSIPEPNSSVFTYLKPIGSKQTISSFIIIHNMVFLCVILLGAPFIFIPTFAEMYFMAIISMPIIGGSILDGYFNYILPNAILEISGAIIGAATGFVLFMFVLESIKRNNNIINTKTYGKFIFAGILMAVLSFLFAWPIETKIIFTKYLSIEWLKTFYFIDFYMLSVDFIIIFKIIKNNFISILEYFSLYFYISLFLFGVIAAPKINLDYFYLIIFGAISLYFLLLSFTNIFKKDETEYKINNNTFKLLQTAGHSMNPALNAGDKMIVKEIGNIKEIKVGDIIAYKTLNIYFPLNAAGIVAHRVYRIIDNRIITKGDNNKKIDKQKIKFDDVIGIVVAKVVFINYKRTKIELLDDSTELKENLFYSFPFTLNSIKRPGNIFSNMFLIVLSVILILIII